MSQKDADFLTTYPPLSCNTHAGAGNCIGARAKGDTTFGLERRLQSNSGCGLAIHHIRFLEFTLLRSVLSIPSAILVRDS
jgi:hypothetical protein